MLLQEAVDACCQDLSGRYVDATYGRGGHSAAILARLSPDGRLLAIDRDPEAVAAPLVGDSRFHLVHGAFGDLASHVQAHWGVGRLSGVLFDLGVSSPHLDCPERGFSFQHDGPLDMRMDPTTGVSAAQWLAEVDEAELARVLWEYGEERHSRRIARALIAARAERPLNTTAQLAEQVTRAHPRWPRKRHPATQTFQAIRMHINDELGQLRLGLEQAEALLAPGGHLVVISFHSLEDRLVKQFMRAHSEPARGPRGLPPPPGAPEPTLQVVQRASRPSAAEVEANPRARSAVMRVAAKR